MPRSPSRKSDKPYKAQANLDVLFGDAPESSTTSMSVKLEAIVVPPQQIRRYFDPEKMAQLTASVREHGILENLLVRPIPKPKGAYELVAGERRYRAAREAGLTDIYGHVRSTWAIKKYSDENVSVSTFNYYS